MNAALFRQHVLPVVLVIAGLFALWVVACVPVNIRDTLTAAAREGVVVTPEAATARQEVGTLRLLLDNSHALGGSWSLERPRLPAPQQVLAELKAATWDEEVHSRRGIVQSGSWSNRSLVYHAGLTLGATVAGFVIGAALGVLLAIGITYNRAMDMSVMPWAVISQTVPIVALAPMIIIVLNSLGMQGLLPKAVISAYLSFFPVVVGMVKGLRAPDAMQIDQMTTWNASRRQELWKLRLPASVPYLFASLKVAIAASLVGTIVGELPVQRGGLGANIFSASYYGQTAKIWASLLIAAVMAAALVWLVGWLERRTARLMGAPKEAVA